MNFGFAALSQRSVRLLPGSSSCPLINTLQDRRQVKSPSTQGDARFASATSVSLSDAAFPRLRGKGASVAGAQLAAGAQSRDVLEIRALRVLAGRRRGPS